MKIEELKWDSNFFNRKIGSLFLTKIDKNITIDNNIPFDLLYVRSKKEHSVQIKNFHNSYSEVKVVFSKNISQITSGINHNISSLSKDKYEINTIYGLAYESGKVSRFNLDSGFKRENFKSLYQAWVDNSLNNKFADDVFVYKEQDSILGFVTYRIFDEYAVIGLIAVNPESQGKGIGHQLLQTVESLLVDKNITELRIPTQLKNTQACSFYTKQGYKIIETEYIKHYWRI